MLVMTNMLLLLLMVMIMIMMMNPKSYMFYVANCTLCEDVTIISQEDGDNPDP